MPKKKKQTRQGKPNKKQLLEKKRQKQQRWVILGTTIGILILLFAVVAIVVQNNKTAEQNDKLALDNGNASQQKVTEISYEGQPMMGQEDAPIKIAEFGDYRCPNCQQFTLKIFPELKKDYIDTGKVQFYFINYTILGPGSVLAADAAESIYHNYPDKFWNFHELLYEKQGPEEEQWVTKDILSKIAKQAIPDVNEQTLIKDIDKVTYKDALSDDKNMGTSLGVTGTPTLFLNGKMVSVDDTFNYNNLKKLIDKTLNAEE